MPRIADALERESRTVDLEPGDFERLVGRRERKQRNRRIRAGAVGVIVALVTAAVLVRSLTSHTIPADRSEPQPAPAASGALVYALLGGDIYLAHPDGTNAVAITDAFNGECRGGYWSPSWSPDGRYLAFSGGTGCSSPGSVVITDPQGNVVANAPVPGGRFAWSPDSTRFAVWDENSYNEAGVGTFKIGIYGIDGTHETQIALPPGSDSGGRLAWTPDGNSLIVNHLEVPVDGGTPRDIPFVEAFRSRSGGIWNAALAYSPDGSQVAYGTHHALMVARSDWSEPREVLAEAAHTATWSPTGGLIAVTADAPGDPWAPNQLRVVDPATGSATLLFEGEAGTWLNVIGFSPDGDRILFGEQRPVSGQPDGTSVYSLWSIGVDGTDARLLVAGAMEGEWRPR